MARVHWEDRLLQLGDDAFAPAGRGADRAASPSVAVIQPVPVLAEGLHGRHGRPGPAWGHAIAVYLAVYSVSPRGPKPRSSGRLPASCSENFDHAHRARGRLRAPVEHPARLWMREYVISARRRPAPGRKRNIAVVFRRPRSTTTSAGSSRSALACSSGPTSTSAGSWAVLYTAGTLATRHWRALAAFLRATWRCRRHAAFSCVVPRLRFFPPVCQDALFDRTRRSSCRLPDPPVAR